MKRARAGQNSSNTKRVVIAHKSDPSSLQNVTIPPCSVDPASCDPPETIKTWKEKRTSLGPKRSSCDLKISVWNVNGLRSVLKPLSSFDDCSPLLEYVRVEQPDILCLNETKIHADLIPEFQSHHLLTSLSFTLKFSDILPGYKSYFLCSHKKGYAGVATFVRESSQRLCFDLKKWMEGLGSEMHDTEGRVQTFLVTPSPSIPPFYLVNTYVVNAGQGLLRLQYKIDCFNKDLFQHLNKLRESHPVIWTGDLNVAHQEIDIWNSKGNQKSAGHTPQERVSFGEFLSCHGWIDVFRHFYPKKIQYTYWSAMQRSNLDQNRGWRIDLAVVTKDILPYIIDFHTRDFVRGSDHCPIVTVLGAPKVDCTEKSAAVCPENVDFVNLDKS